MRKVLVVDDDKDLLEMVMLVLTSYDLAVSCIDRGGLLFDSLVEERPDVILMDIYLGDTDGRELCHTIKKSDQYRDIPVILYSAGNIKASSVQESLADDFIIKPFDIEQLVRKINKTTPSN